MVESCNGNQTPKPEQPAISTWPNSVVLTAALASYVVQVPGFSMDNSQGSAPPRCDRYLYQGGAGGHATGMAQKDNAVPLI